MISYKEEGRFQTSKTVILLLLVSRFALFLAFQAMVALLANSWKISEKYWLLSATLTNLVSIALLFILFKREGKNYFSIFSFSRANMKKDLLVFLGLAIATVPIVFLPGYFLSIMIWDDPNIPTQMMFLPIEKCLVYILLISFPVSISMAELATYFRYIMPKLKEQFNMKWISILVPVLFLSLQHCTLPFIPDIDFIVYRALVFLPFACLIGISIYYRPSLFIYFAILHGIMDFGTVLMFLSEIK